MDCYYYFCAFPDAPIFIHAAIVLNQDGSSELLSSQQLYKDGWGGKTTISIPHRDSKSHPYRLYIAYYSICEDKHYVSEIDFNEHNIFSKICAFYGEDSDICNLIIGIAPYGKVYFLVSNIDRQELLFYTKSKIIEESLLGLDYDVTKKVKRSEILQNISINPHKYYSILLYPYIFRFIIDFNYENKIASDFKIKYMYYKSFNGIYYRSQDEANILNWSEKGVFHNITLCYRKFKTDYLAYFHLNNVSIIQLYDKFFGIHPDTKTDFIIRIDAENKKYELALYRQGLKEPVVIPESAYQLIVFKNKFEDYRSENYNQPRGAWIW